MSDLETLYENDQVGRITKLEDIVDLQKLNLQMVAGLTFPYYSEARITFMPTYKYDLGTNTYDSS